MAEVQKLLGPHVVDLKTEEDKSPVRDWLFRQQQKDLDRLGLGLQGGIPNGYLVLDINVRGELDCPWTELGGWGRESELPPLFAEAFSSGAPLLGPGFVFAWIPILLPALSPS